MLETRDNVKSFLMRLCSADKKMNFCFLESGIPDFEGAFWKNDVYFCWCMDERMITRFSDSHITAKNYFYFDIDVRKTLATKFAKKNWLSNHKIENIPANLVDEYMEATSDDKIFDVYQKIKVLMDWSIIFSSYSYIVFSGNWLHIYFVGEDMSYTPSVYSVAVKYLMGEFEALTAWTDIEEFELDRACKNLSRLARMPGTMNLNSKKYWLEPKECYILYSQEAVFPLFTWFKSIYDEVEKTSKEEDQLYLSKYATKQKRFEGDTLYEQIEQIDIAPIVMEHLGIQLQRDNKNFKSKTDGSNVWMFINRENNTLINMWTPYLNWDLQAYNPFTFVKYEVLNGGTNKEIFQWFKDKYSHLSDIQEIGKKWQDIVSSSWDTSMLRDIEWYWTWGSDDMDRFFMPMWGSELVVLYGNAGSGKTTFCFRLARKNAAMWIRVLYVTMELTVDRMRRNLCMKRAGIDKYTLITKSYSENQKNIAEWYFHDLNELPNLDFVYAKDPTIDSLEQLIVDNVEKYDMFILDNLGKIWSKASSREIDIQMEVTNRLQTLKNDIKRNIIIVHHSSKAAYWWGKNEWDTMRGTSKITDNATMKMRISRDGDHTILCLQKDTDGNGEQSKSGRMHFNKGEFDFMGVCEWE